jgi:hypothetical protein
VITFPPARIRRRLAGASLLAVAAVGAAVTALAPAARADGSGTSLAGYTVSIQSVGAQIAFNIPGVVPLPNQNLVEEDVPFARTSVSNGPVVNALGAPYYPGDILANIGSLLSEFAPAGAPSVPNDPLLAMADYPPTPGHGQDASFGGTPPAGVPIAPDVFSATAHAGGSGGTATATLTDLSASPPSNTSSSLAQLGPAPGSASGVGGVLGAVAGAAAGAAPLLDVGSIQATNSAAVSGSSVTGTAASVLKSIDLAGVLQISQLVSSASSTSDGSQGTPTASLHLGNVTADGQPAYIDQQGVHVTGTSPGAGGVTPAQAQSALDTTLAQDGITVRLLDPKTTTNGAEGIADAGGLVISMSHQLAVPFVPGEPTVPVPGLGNASLPAGVYTATTSITLGAATSDVQATQAVPFASGGPSVGLSLGGAGGVTLGIPALDGGGATGVAGTGLPTGVAGGTEDLTGVPSAGLGTTPALAGAVHRLPLGIPVPLAWVMAGLLLCVLVTYPMLLTVRWQFLSGRGR